MNSQVLLENVSSLCCVRPKPAYGPQNLNDECIDGFRPLLAKTLAKPKLIQLSNN